MLLDLESSATGYLVGKIKWCQVRAQGQPSFAYRDTPSSYYTAFATAIFDNCPKSSRSNALRLGKEATLPWRDEIHRVKSKENV